MKKHIASTLVALFFALALAAGAFAPVSAGVSSAKAAFAEEYPGEKLAEFSTDYSSSSAARKHNIELAAGFLDGYVVEGGATFSFNSAVGARSAERGFREAPVIEDGKYVKGVGGGVCQVSSTLYNAVIRAGMETVSVAHHSLPVSYLPGSLDAMVSEATDFRFLNVTPYPLRIYSECKKGKLTFTLYGFPVYTDGESVRIRSVTVKVLECKEYERVEDTEGVLKEGEYERYLSHPKNGLVSEAYRDSLYRGKVVSSVRLRRDYYAPQKGVILVSGDDSSAGGQPPRACALYKARSAIIA